MSEQLLDQDFPTAFPYEGIVIDRADPENLGRVRVTIPGEMDESGWVLPVGMPAAGGPGHGAVVVPPLDASVLVFFIGGDKENARYLSGNFGKDEPPSGTAVTDDGDCIVWQDKRVRISVDSRLATTGVKVTDRATGAGVVFEVDVASRSVGITGTLAVTIQSSGTITINGGSVIINGRPVAPGGAPL